MTGHISKLELSWRLSHESNKELCQEYLDFLVDGKSLRDIIGEKTNVGCFGWGTPDSEAVASKELMLERKAELESGRCQIYVCPLCGDIGCGSITVRVEKTQMGFVWKDFGFEYANGGPEELEKYKLVGPYCFDEKEYKKLLIERPVTRWRKIEKNK